MSRGVQRDEPPFRGNGNEQGPKQDSRSPQAASSPAAFEPARVRSAGIERCSRRRIKKGAIPGYAGIRGGSWNNNATNERVSDRNNASWTNTNRNNNVGSRGARTPQGRAMGFYSGEVAGWRGCL